MFSINNGFTDQTSLVGATLDNIPPAAIAQVVYQYASAQLQEWEASGQQGSLGDRLSQNGFLIEVEEIEGGNPLYTLINLEMDAPLMQLQAIEQEGQVFLSIIEDSQPKLTPEVQIALMQAVMAYADPYVKAALLAEYTASGNQFAEIAQTVLMTESGELLVEHPSNDEPGGLGYPLRSIGFQNQQTDYTELLFYTPTQWSAGELPFDALIALESELAQAAALTTLRLQKQSNQFAPYRLSELERQQEIDRQLEAGERIAIPLQPVRFRGEDLTINLMQYETGAVAIRLIDEDGLPYATATRNVPQLNLQAGQVVIYDEFENEGLLQALVDQQVVSWDGQYQSVVGFGRAAVCTLNIDLERQMQIVTPEFAKAILNRAFNTSSFPVANQLTLQDGRELDELAYLLYNYITNTHGVMEGKFLSNALEVEGISIEVDSSYNYRVLQEGQLLFAAERADQVSPDLNGNIRPVYPPSILPIHSNLTTEQFDRLQLIAVTALFTHDVQQIMDLSATISNIDLPQQAAAQLVYESLMGEDFNQGAIIAAASQYLKDLESGTLEPFEIDPLDLVEHYNQPNDFLQAVGVLRALGRDLTQASGGMLSCQLNLLEQEELEGWQGNPGNFEIRVSKSSDLVGFSDALWTIDLRQLDGSVSQYALNSTEALSLLKSVQSDVYSYISASVALNSMENEPEAIEQPTQTHGNEQSQTLERNPDQLAYLLYSYLRDSELYEGESLEVAGFTLQVGDDYSYKLLQSDQVLMEVNRQQDEDISPFLSDNLILPDLQLQSFSLSNAQYDALQQVAVEELFNSDISRMADRLYAYSGNTSRDWADSIAPYMMVRCLRGEPFSPDVMNAARRDAETDRQPDITLAELQKFYSHPNELVESFAILRQMGAIPEVDFQMADSSYQVYADLELLDRPSLADWQDNPGNFQMQLEMEWDFIALAQANWSATHTHQDGRTEELNLNPTEALELLKQVRSQLQTYSNSRQVDQDQPVLSETQQEIEMATENELEQPQPDEQSPDQQISVQVEPERLSYLLVNYYISQSPPPSLIGDHFMEVADGNLKLFGQEGETVFEAQSNGNFPATYQVISNSLTERQSYDLALEASFQLFQNYTAEVRSTIDGRAQSDTDYFPPAIKEQLYKPTDVSEVLLIDQIADRVAYGRIKQDLMLQEGVGTAVREVLSDATEGIYQPLLVENRDLVSFFSKPTDYERAVGLLIEMNADINPDVARIKGNLLLANQSALDGWEGNPGNIGFKGYDTTAPVYLGEASVSWRVDLVSEVNIDHLPEKLQSLYRNGDSYDMNSWEMLQFLEQVQSHVQQYTAQYTPEQMAVFSQIDRLNEFREDIHVPLIGEHIQEASEYQLHSLWSRLYQYDQEFGGLSIDYSEGYPGRDAVINLYDAFEQHSRLKLEALGMASDLQAHLADVEQLSSSGHETHIQSLQDHLYQSFQDGTTLTLKGVSLYLQVGDASVESLTVIPVMDDPKSPEPTLQAFHVQMQLTDGKQAEMQYGADKWRYLEQQLHLADLVNELPPESVIYYPHEVEQPVQEATQNRLIDRLDSLNSQFAYLTQAEPNGKNFQFSSGEFHFSLVTGNTQTQAFGIWAPQNGSLDLIYSHQGDAATHNQIGDRSQALEVALSDVMAQMDTYPFARTRLAEPIGIVTEVPMPSIPTQSALSVSKQTVIDSPLPQTPQSSALDVDFLNQLQQMTAQVQPATVAVEASAPVEHELAAPAEVSTVQLPQSSALDVDFFNQLQQMTAQAISEPAVPQVSQVSFSNIQASEQLDDQPTQPLQENDMTKVIETVQPKSQAPSQSGPQANVQFFGSKEKDTYGANIYAGKASSLIASQTGGEIKETQDGRSFVTVRGEANVNKAIAIAGRNAQVNFPQSQEWKDKKQAQLEAATPAQILTQDLSTVLAMKVAVANILPAGQPPKGSYVKGEITKGAEGSLKVAEGNLEWGVGKNGNYYMLDRTLTGRGGNFQSVDPKTNSAPALVFSCNPKSKEVVTNHLAAANQVRQQVGAQAYDFTAAAKYTRDNSQQIINAAMQPAKSKAGDGR